MKLPAPPGTLLVSVAPGLTVTRQQKRLARVKAGIALQAGDIMSTPAAGEVIVRLGDQAIVTLRRGATFEVVEALKPLDKPGETVSRLKLTAGELFIRLRALKGQSRVLIETPSAVTAARGTAFLVGLSGESTEVLVEEGRVDVSLPGAPERMLSVAAGQKAVVAPGILPAMPSPLDDADRARLAAFRNRVLPVGDDVSPLIAQIDRLIAAKRYGEAKLAGAYVADRAWGTPAGVRGHARAWLATTYLYEWVLDRGLNDSLVLQALILLPASLREPGTDPAAIETARRSVLPIFRGDAVAADVVEAAFAIKELELVLGKPRNSAPAAWRSRDWERGLETTERLLRSPCGVQTRAALCSYRALALHILAWAADVNGDRDAARKRFAERDRMGQEILASTGAPPFLRLSSLYWLAETLAPKTGEVPGHRWDSAERQRSAKQYVREAMAQPATATRRLPNLTLAYAEDGQPERAEEYGRAALNAGGSDRLEGWMAGKVAQAYLRAGNRAKEQEWSGIAARLSSGAASP